MMPGLRACVVVCVWSGLWVGKARGGGVVADDAGALLFFFMHCQRPRELLFLTHSQHTNPTDTYSIIPLPCRALSCSSGQRACLPAFHPLLTLRLPSPPPFFTHPTQPAAAARTR